MKGQQIKALYEFAEFCLDTEGRTLWKEGNPVSLTPKAFDTLVVLIRHQGKVVEKDELLKEVWPDAFVEEATLTQNISTLRKALGQNRDDRLFIETIPKHGYRFVACVKELTQEETSDVEIVGKIVRTRIIKEEIEHTDSQDNINVKDITNDAPQVIDNNLSLQKNNRSTTLQRISNTSLITRLGKQPVTLMLILLLPVLLLTAAITLQRFFKRKPLEASLPSRFEKMRFTKLTNTGNVKLTALSPDGNYVAYVQQDGQKESIWLRQPQASNNVQVVQLENSVCSGINFSKDSSYIYYTVIKKNEMIAVLYQVPTLGGTPRKIIEDVDSEISFSPDSRQFAFIRNIPTEKEAVMIAVNADGSSPRVVMKKRRPEILSYQAISWAPDGKSIACVVRLGENTNPYYSIIAVSVDKGEEKALSNDRWSWVGPIFWTSDGKDLMFCASDAKAYNFTSSLWRLSYPEGKASKITNDLNDYYGISMSKNADHLATLKKNRITSFWIAPASDFAKATRITTVTDNQHGEIMGMAFAPNNQILFASSMGQDVDLWTINADGSNLKQLTFEPGPDFMPSITRDGRTIVFVSWRTGSPHIWSMNIDGSNPKQLTNGAAAETHSDVSPDGKWIVYSSIKDGMSTIWKTSIDTGESVQLTQTLSRFPKISPDGRFVAYCFNETPLSVTKIGVVPVSGGDPIKVFDAPDDSSLIARLRWTSDSRALTYVTNDEKASNLWVQPLNNKPSRKLTNFQTDNIYRFDWSKDGKYVAFERGTEINDTVLITFGEDS